MSKSDLIHIFETYTKHFFMRCFIIFYLDLFYLIFKEIHFEWFIFPKKHLKDQKLRICYGYCVIVSLTKIK